jgi:sec-independent protein translocase protein TatB
MFGIDSSELLVIALVALIVIGPKDLPRVMRTVGHWVGRARGMAGHFRAGVDTMIRESELADMEKKWKAENERIMRDHPAATPSEEKWAEPIGDESVPPVKKASAPRKSSTRPKAPPARGAPAPRAAAPPIPAPQATSPAPPPPAPPADDPAP